MPPIQSPEKVARVLVRMDPARGREPHVPAIAVLGLAWHWLMPRTVERLILDMLRQWHFGRVPDRPNPGNRCEPDAADPSTVHGTRPPLVAAPTLFAWVAGRLVRLL